MNFPDVDPARQESISTAQADFYRKNGLLVIRNLLAQDELHELQSQTLPLVRRAVTDHPNDPDYFYKRHDVTGEQVPYRVEYVVDKLPACRALLGHPFVLRSIESLQGPDFIPTWDSMVFKPEGRGASIPWHRDDDSPAVKNCAPITNVDFYLDKSDLTNCLWGIPGSNKWSSEEARARIAELNRDMSPDAMERAGAVPLPMSPGDVIFHNVLVLHGSAASQSDLRRVVYYEFRPIDVELGMRPHTPEYIPLKQRVLNACLQHRAAAAYSANERPFQYSAQVPPGLCATLRVPHANYWRAGPIGAG